MADLSKIAKTALGSVALAAVPASAVAVPLDIEPNSTFATAQSAAVGAPISGHLCLDPCSPLDTADFFKYTGLPAGGTFDLLFVAFDVDFGDFLSAGLYTDATTIASFVDSFGQPAVHLNGSIPGSGQLIFGITAGPSVFEFEGYNALLTVTGARVPAPAAIVLLAAGLTAVGLNAARRRKRS